MGSERRDPLCLALLGPWPMKDESMYYLTRLQLLGGEGKGERRSRGWFGRFGLFLSGLGQQPTRFHL